MDPYKGQENRDWCQNEIITWQNCTTAFYIQKKILNLLQTVVHTCLVFIAAVHGIRLSCSLQTACPSKQTWAEIFKTTCSLIIIRKHDGMEEQSIPASQLRGLSASGCAKRAITARQTDCSVHAGLHAVFNISKQISPVCQIFNQICTILMIWKMLQHSIVVYIHNPTCLWIWSE